MTEKDKDNNQYKFSDSLVGKIFIYTWRILGVFFIVYALRGCFYLPAQERAFVNNIETAFTQTDHTWVFVRDVTEFEWDTVCGFGYYTYPDALKALTARYLMFKPLPQTAPEVFAERSGYDLSVFRSHVPRNGWFNFSGSHFFFKNDEIVKKYVYTKWFIPMYNGRETFNFMHEHAIDEKTCLNFDNAVFYFDNSNKNYEPYMVLKDKRKIDGVK